MTAFQASSSYVQMQRAANQPQSRYLASMTACLTTRAVRAMDVSMSSALLLCFVSRCRSGSAEVKSPLLIHDCESATIR